MQREVDEQGSRIVTPNYQSHTDEHGTQKIEIEMPGVKKDEINVDLDKNGRVLIVTGNRYSNNKSAEPEVEEKSDGKDDDNNKEEQNGKDNNERNKPAIVYKWKGHVNRMAQIEDVQAEHSGDGILRIVLQAEKKSERMKIQIQDA